MTEKRTIERDPRRPHGGTVPTARPARGTGSGGVFGALLAAALLVGCASADPAPPDATPRPGPDGAGVEAPRTEAAEAEVLAVVHGLFDAMRAKDIDFIENAFHPDARLVTTAEQGGRPVVASVPADRFVRSVAGAEGELNEVIWGEQVRIRDNLATVWTEYSFYLDDELHHCGVNAFQLARTVDGWKIVQVADTRREEGCEDRR